MWSAHLHGIANHLVGIWWQRGRWAQAGVPQPPPVMLCSHFSPAWLLQLVPKLSRNYLKEGYMEKTGPKVGYKCFCNNTKTKACSVWDGEGSAGGTNLSSLRR